MPVVMQPRLAIEVLPRISQVHGDAAAGRAVAKGLAIPAPQHLLRGIGREPGGVELVRVEIANRLLGGAAAGGHEFHGVGDDRAVGLVGERHRAGRAGAEGVGAEQYPLAAVDTLVYEHRGAAGAVFNRERGVAGVAAGRHPAGVDLVAAGGGDGRGPHRLVFAAALGVGLVVAPVEARQARGRGPGAGEHGLRVVENDLRWRNGDGLDLGHRRVVGIEIGAHERAGGLGLGQQSAREVVMVDRALTAHGFAGAQSTKVIEIVARDPAQRYLLYPARGIIGVAAPAAVAQGLASGIDGDAAAGGGAQAVAGREVDVGAAGFTRAVAIPVVAEGRDGGPGGRDLVLRQAIQRVVQVGPDLRECLFAREVAVEVVTEQAGVGGD